MITKLKVETKHDDVCVLHGIKASRTDQSQYVIEFIPNKNSTYFGNVDASGKTILKSAGMNTPNMISFDFRLKRGLYDVSISKVKRIEGANVEIEENSSFQYREPVMVGDPYKIKLKIEEANCYGCQGVRVRIASVEIPLDSNTVYYQIKRENINHIKYYIPFNQGKTVDFFIKGVKPEEVDIYFGNPSFQIEKA